MSTKANYERDLDGAIDFSTCVAGAEMAESAPDATFRWPAESDERWQKVKECGTRPDYRTIGCGFAAPPGASSSLLAASASEVAI